MDFELVVFDMAGTTVYDPGIVNIAFRNAFKVILLDVSVEDVDEVMGYRKIEAIEIVLKKYLSKELITEELMNRIHDDFTQKLVEYYQQDTTLKPLPFTIETFEWLKEKGIKVALNTGFTRVITDAILIRLGWKNNPLIQAVVTSDEVIEGRPHPYMIKEIMQQLGVTDVQKIVKVGDTSVDVLEGQFVGCGLVVAVTTGAFKREQLEDYQPDHIIDSLSELPALLC